MVFNVPALRERRRRYKLTTTLLRLTTGTCYYKNGNLKDFLENSLVALHITLI